MIGPRRVTFTLATPLVIAIHHSRNSDPSSNIDDNTMARTQRLTGQCNSGRLQLRRDAEQWSRDGNRHHGMRENIACKVTGGGVADESSPVSIQTQSLALRKRKPQETQALALASSQSWLPLLRPSVPIGWRLRLLRENFAIKSRRNKVDENK